MLLLVLALLLPAVAASPVSSPIPLPNPPRLPIPKPPEAPQPEQPDASALLAEAAEAAGTGRVEEALGGAGQADLTQLLPPAPEQNLTVDSPPVDTTEAERHLAAVERAPQEAPSPEDVAAAVDPQQAEQTLRAAADAAVAEVASTQKHASERASPYVALVERTQQAIDPKNPPHIPENYGSNAVEFGPDLTAARPLSPRYHGVGDARNAFPFWQPSVPALPTGLRAPLYNLGQAFPALAAAAGMWVPLPFLAVEPAQPAPGATSGAGPEPADAPGAKAYGTAAARAEATESLGLLLAAAATTGLSILAVAAVLYHLLSSGDLLKNKVRARIHEAIKANPGIAVNDLTRLVGVRHQTVCYHLKVLEKGRFVVAYDKGKGRAYFANGSGYTEEARSLVAAAKSPAAQKILQLVRTSGSVIKKDVAEALGVTPNAVTWHMRKLLATGLITVEKRHGQCVIRATEDKLAQLEALHGADVGTMSGSAAV